MPDKLSEIVLILVGSTMIILTLTSLVITTLVISRKRKFRHEMEIADLKNEYERELLRTQLEIQSQTFETISRELHDNVGTLLSIALVHVNAATPNSEVETLINEAMDILRDISRSLNPDSINRMGWQKSLLNELQRIDRSNRFNIKTSVAGEPVELEPSRQIILFRILQEAINNIVKHAAATEVSVDIGYDRGQTTIRVSDNGKGISTPLNGKPAQGSGLQNMRARAAMLPAELIIDSEPGKGTTINIHIKN